MFIYQFIFAPFIKRLPEIFALVCENPNINHKYLSTPQIVIV